MFSAVGANFQNSCVENTDFGNICLDGTQMLHISKNENEGLAEAGEIKIVQE